MELECAVYGEGTVFPVKIARDAKVCALQEAIARILSTEQHAVAPRLLSLYLARKNDSWLKDDDNVDDFLQGKIDTAYKKMRPSWRLDDKELLGSNIDLGEKTIHILVELPTQQPIASIKKQLRYKEMSTEASCRKFLDALAQKLANLYDFDFNYGVPTIGDVFYAVANDTWDFRSRKGNKLTQIKLPNFFTKDEWTILKDLNMRTNRRIHDGLVPTTRKGHPYIILPHDYFGGDQVETLKEIAAKGQVVFLPTEFDVKDEDEFSSSSRSSSAHSADARLP